MPFLLIGGLVVFLAGAALFCAWFGAVAVVLKALAPLAMLGAGAVAVYLGWEELRDKRPEAAGFSSPTEASRYQKEAQAYQDEMEKARRGEGVGPQSRL